MFCGEFGWKDLAGGVAVRSVWRSRMRVVIQRVSSASVKVEGSVVGSIGRGLLILVAFEESDRAAAEDREWMIEKICGLRIFSDEQQFMNLSVKDVDGEVLLVSQFTLYASTRKGKRPSFNRALAAEYAGPLFHEFVVEFESRFGGRVATGQFGADMQVYSVNDGPVTLIVDSALKE